MGSRCTPRQPAEHLRMVTRNRLWPARDPRHNAGSSERMRLLLFELRPPLLQEQGLATALQARLKAVETRAGLLTDFESNGTDLRRLAPEMEQELYRLAQEALNNILKHAHAERVRVRLAI